MTEAEADAYAVKVERDYMNRLAKEERRKFGKKGYNIEKTTLTGIVDNLFRAAKQGSPIELRYALLDGADIDAQDSMGNTALHYATMGGFLPTVYTLLEYGANPNIQNKHGKKYQNIVYARLND